MKTIFLVEDNPADVELFRMALQEVGIECNLVLFEDGAEIINYIRGASVPAAVPDLIVLDLNLPRSDGLEILQFLRGHAAYADVSIAVLSSSSSSRERAKLAAFKIREYIAKPPDLEEYLRIGHVVRNLLEQP